MQPATISGFRIKIWGPFPALVPSESGTVNGCVWDLDHLDQIVALNAYESSAHKPIFCNIATQDADGNEVIKEARMFC